MPGILGYAKEYKGILGYSGYTGMYWVYQGILGYTRGLAQHVVVRPKSPTQSITQSAQDLQKKRKTLFSTITVICSRHLLLLNGMI